VCHADDGRWNGLVESSGIVGAGVATWAVPSGASTAFGAAAVGITNTPEVVVLCSDVWMLG